jgi:hypothetical protein
MSTRFRAYLTGLVLGSGAVAYIHRRYIENPQKDILYDLRSALMSSNVQERLMRNEFPRATSRLISRETLNLALIAISDRLIFQ